MSIATLTILLATATLVEDQIIKRGSGKPVNGTVISESLQEVQYRPSGSSGVDSIPASQVADVIYEGAPKSLKEGRRYLSEGDFLNAINSLKLAKGEKDADDWAKIHAAFFLGVAYLRSGAQDSNNYGQAASTFEALVKDHPECRFLPQAMKHWGEALSMAGDAAAAAQVFDKLAAEVTAKSLGTLWMARAKALKGDAYELNDMDPEARAAYGDAGSFARGAADDANSEDERQELLSIAAKARLYDGVSALKKGDYQKARGVFQPLVQDESASQAERAGAEAGLGQVLFAEGDFKNALEQFALVRIRHFLVREEAARATYFMGKCCAELGSKEPNGKRKAREYFQEVTTHYGETSWASRAQTEIQ